MITLTFAEVNQLHLYMQMLVDGATFEETPVPPALSRFDLVLDVDYSIQISVSARPEVDDNGVIPFPGNPGGASHRATEEDE